MILTKMYLNLSVDDQMYIQSLNYGSHSNAQYKLRAEKRTKLNYIIPIILQLAIVRFLTKR